MGAKDSVLIARLGGADGEDIRAAVVHACGRERRQVVGDGGTCSSTAGDCLSHQRGAIDPTIEGRVEGKEDCVWAYIHINWRRSYRNPQY